MLHNAHPKKFPLFFDTNLIPSVLYPGKGNDFHQHCNAIG